MGFSPESSVAGCEHNFNHMIILEQLAGLEWSFLKKQNHASFNETGGNLRFCFES